mgnify:CR=1 FL=1
MKVLVINCGSSSLKYQLIDMEGEKVLCKGLCERIGMESSMITHEANGQKATTPAIFPTHTEAFTEVVKKMTTGAGKVIDSVSEIDAIGHRVVHGGEKFKESCLITPEVVKAIHDLSPLAPLHNPAAILGIEASYKVFGQDKPNVAVFDTAFHSTMPPKAYMYAIPYEYYEKYGVRRYGFHGTSHKYVSHRAAEFLEEPIERLKLITCHLGNGSSIAAVDQGKVIDTSMGMTPLAGLMMGTRCGDLDPSVVNYLKYNLEITGHELDEILNKKSGLLGVSGVSSDKRDVEDAAMNGNKRAQLASDMLNYQIKKTIGSYIAAMAAWTPSSLPAASVSMTPIPAPRSAITWIGWASASTLTRTAMPTSRRKMSSRSLPGRPCPHADHRDQRRADDRPRHEGRSSRSKVIFSYKKSNQKNFNICSRERVTAGGCGMGLDLVRQPLLWYNQR